MENRLAMMTDLAYSTDPEAESQLIGVALRAPETAIRSEAAHALGERGGPGATQTLQRMLADTDPAVRKSAVRALVDIGGDASALAIGALLSSIDTDLRLTAVEALGEIGGAYSAQLLQQALQDGHDIIRDAASQWLAEYSRTPLSPNIEH
jgi:HEAT repeat protein